MHFSILGAFLHGPVRVRIVHPVTRIAQRIIRAEAKSELDVAMHYVCVIWDFCGDQRRFNRTIHRSVTQKIHLR